MHQGYESVCTLFFEVITALPFAASVIAVQLVQYSKLLLSDFIVYFIPAPHTQHNTTQHIPPHPHPHRRVFKSAIHLAIVLTFESLRRHLKGKCGSENGIRVPVPLPPHASTLMFSYRSWQCVW